MAKEIFLSKSFRRDSFKNKKKANGDLFGPLATPHIGRGFLLFLMTFDLYYFCFVCIGFFFLFLRLLPFLKKTELFLLFFFRCFSSLFFYFR